LASTSEQEDKIVIARLTIAAAALASIAVPALAAPAGSAPGETRIRQIGARLEIVPDPRQGVFIQDYRGRWFHASTQGDCPRLTYNAHLRLIASPGGYFDSRSAIVADGWRCLVASVTPSDGPPRRNHRR
jgi:hypothetical protein